MDIYIKGKTVMKQYYGDSHIYDEDNWFNTGDLGFLSDGILAVCGRAKDLIVVNGHNYYPQDIELIIEKELGIPFDKVVAVGKFDETVQTEELYLFITEDQQTAENLNQRIKEVTADYLHVNVKNILYVDKIPKTGSGKKQRFKLLESINSNKSFDKESINQKPVNDMVLSLWRSVLDEPDINEDDNFFALSGNSLKASLLINKINKSFFISMSLTQIYKTPTIKTLMEVIISHMKQKNYVEQQIPVAKKAKLYPLSPAQNRQYFLSKTFDGSFYYIDIVYQITGAIDIQKLNTAIKKMISRHEILRTAFITAKEEVWQQINESCEFELTEVSEADIYADNYRFDLENGLLFRGYICSVSDEKYILRIIFHISGIHGNGQKQDSGRSDGTPLPALWISKARPCPKRAYIKRIKFKLRHYKTSACKEPDRKCFHFYGQRLTND